ncbi:MAG: hypothetical protein HFJ07_18650 [Lachnospiraceae bacterium]|nr:hypothetical protein [Lachnospiraceae bacterium]
MLTDKKIGGYYIAARRVITNIFGRREVMAYVTSPAKESSTRRLFFSTIFPEQLEIFCAFPLNQTGSSRMQYIPFLLYLFRWNIEVIVNAFSFCAIQYFLYLCKTRKAA